MPLCPNCGSHDVEEVDDATFACNECQYMFNFEGKEPEELAIPDSLPLDMQEFEDRISCIGDD